MNQSQYKRRIGFVDFRLDNFHANVFLDAIRGPLAKQGFEVSGAWAMVQEPSREWASRKHVPFFDDLAVLNEHVDAYMILAPSNPELHLTLCQEVFPRSKPTYVDKTFAPDLISAQRIFSLADHYRTPVQTSSALRYANVRAEILGLNATVHHLAVWGGGTSFQEYGIHPIELAVSIMGPTVIAMSALKCGNHHKVILRFADERTATIEVNCSAHVPYLVAATTDAETRIIQVDDAHLFVDTAAAVLDFLTMGVPKVDRAETLLIRQILDLTEDKTRLGSWVWLDTQTRPASIPRPKSANLPLRRRDEAASRSVTSEREH